MKSWIKKLLIKINNFIKSDNNLEKKFLLILIPIGILYLLFIIPYHVPDEAPHIIRAYEVYNGEFISSLNEDGKHRAIIPKDFIEINLSNLYNYDTLKNQLSKKTDYKINKEAYTEAQGYPGILYMISGLGMKIGQILNLNIVLSMYLARIFNFIFFVVLAYY